MKNVILAMLTVLASILPVGCLNFDIPAVDTDSLAKDSNSADTDVILKSTESDSLDSSSMMVSSDGDSASDTLNDTGTDLGTDTSSTTGLDTGNDTGVDTGSSNSDVDSGSDTGVDTRDTGVDSGSDTGMDPHDTGVDTRDTGVDSGSDTGTMTDTDDTDSSTQPDSASDSDSTTDTVEDTEDTWPFDAKPLVVPILTESGGEGNVTAAGSVSAPGPSIGGACDYGTTGILYYGAINVNQYSGDQLGQWKNGRICGECAAVTAQTATGDQTVVVRIMDRCADEICGIGIGGEPANAVMGDQPGRYFGSWEFVPCADGGENVLDGSAAIHVKDGSGPGWALIQVRNPPASVKSIAWEKSSGIWEAFDYAYDVYSIENYFVVPATVRQESEPVKIRLQFNFDITITMSIIGNQLTAAGSNLALPLP